MFWSSVKLTYFWSIFPFHNIPIPIFGGYKMGTLARILLVGVVDYIKEISPLEKRWPSLCYNPMVWHCKSPTYPRCILVEGIRLEFWVKKYKRKSKVEFFLQKWLTNGLRLKIDYHPRQKETVKTLNIWNRCIWNN